MKFRTLVCVLFFLSGATSLVYEVVWSRILVLVFGATALAVSTVLSAFMGGLALGGYAGGQWGRRLSRPFFAYGVVEIAIGVYGLAVPAFFSGLGPVHQAVGESLGLGFFGFSLVRFLFSLSVLAIPTALMGATLPLLSEYLGRTAPRDGVALTGWLYGINTAGAAVGAFSAGYWLLPVLGMSLTVRTTGLANVALGLCAILASKRMRAPLGQDSGQLPGADGGEEPRPSGEGTGDARRLGLPGLVMLGIGASGLVALAYEVAWTRILILVFGSSVYSFTAVLTTFLIGIAIGGLTAARVVGSLRRPILAFGLMEAMVGVTAFATVFLFERLPGFYVELAGPLAAWHDALLVVRFCVSILVMLAPTVLLGALFPVAVRVYSGRAGLPSRAAGRVYAANTLGAIMGAFLAGFIAIPLIGAQGTVLAGIMLNLIIGGVCVIAGLAGGWRRTAAVVSIAVIGITAVMFRPSWNALVMTSGPGVYLPAYARELTTGSKGLEEYLKDSREMLFYGEGLTSTVAVVRNKQGNLLLTVDGKVDAKDTKGSLATQALLAHLPLLLGGEAKQVLVVGVGSGVTASAALAHPVERVRVIELEKTVIEGSKFFAGVNGRYWEDGRVRIEYNDGRNAVAAVGREKIDVIISQPSDPWVRGASNLFTKDFFEAVRDKLSEEGVYAQWLPGYSGSEHIRTLAATFGSVFETVYVFQPPLTSDLVFVASKRPLRISIKKIEDAMRREPAALSLGALGIRNAWDVLALLRMGPKEAAGLAQGAMLNTDDNAWIEFNMPIPGRVRSGTEGVDLFIQGMGPGFPFSYLDGFAESPAGGAESRRRLAAAYRRLGETMLAAGSQPPMIVHLFGRSVELDPDSVGGLVGRAKVLFGMGKTAEALQDLRDAMQRHNLSPEPVVEYARFLDEIGAKPEAEQYYEKAVVLLRRIGDGSASRDEIGRIVERLEQMRRERGMRASG